MRRNNRKKNQFETKKKHTSSQDRYLITYADLLTLLFALFVILYSISKPDNEKMQEILRAMNNVFNPTQLIEGNNLSPNISSSPTPPLILFQEKVVHIPEMQDTVENSLASLIKNNTVGFERIPEGVKLTVRDKFLFVSAKATLRPESDYILDSLAAILGKINMQIQVDGHTDAVPIKSISYESNWQLSAARATNVVQALMDRGVPAYNMVIRAYGEQRPISDNLTEEGKEKNRRVEIIITPKDSNVATTSNEETENNLKNK